MIHSANIDSLRAHIAKQERSANRTWPVADLGVAALDDALPSGGLSMGALHEFQPDTYGDFSATLGFGLGALARILKKRNGHILWALTAHQNFTTGALHPAGLSSFGIDPNRLIHVKASKTQNILWALEEALAHNSIAAVVGILPENDRIYNFTYSRRLSMYAARHGVTPLILSRQSRLGISTAAEMRWSIASAPSNPAHRTGQYVPGLGAARWNVRLVKSRKGAVGQWTVEWDHEELSFRLATPLGNRTPVRLSGVGTGQRAASQWATAAHPLNDDTEWRKNYRRQ